MTAREREERLRDWIETVPHEKLKEIALECVEELIRAEMVGFYDTTRAPYWDATGERLDGLPDRDEDAELIMYQDE